MFFNYFVVMLLNHKDLNPVRVDNLEIILGRTLFTGEAANWHMFWPVWCSVNCWQLELGYINIYI